MSSELDEKPETVMPFKVTIRRSEDLKELLKALILAKKEFGPVVRTLDNEAYKRGGKASKYADLATVIEATEPALLKNGLVIIQHVQGHHVTKETVVTTQLFHESGQFIESDLSVPSVNQQGRFDPQTVASGSTYARRYGWQAITGTAPQDDDGNAASGVGSKAAAQAVGEAKAAELRSKSKKPENAPASAPDTLFYTYPENFNGHYAEFINLKAYGSSLNEVAQEGLRLTFKKYLSSAKGEKYLVAKEKLPALLQELNDCKVGTHELEPS